MAVALVTVEKLSVFFISYYVGYQHLSGKYKCMYPGMCLVKHTLNIRPKCSWVLVTNQNDRKYQMTA